MTDINVIKLKVINATPEVQEDIIKSMDSSEIKYCKFLEKDEVFADLSEQFKEYVVTENIEYIDTGTLAKDYDIPDNSMYGFVDGDIIFKPEGSEELEDMIRVTPEMFNQEKYKITKEEKVLYAEVLGYTEDETTEKLTFSSINNIELEENEFLWNTTFN